MNSSELFSIMVIGPTASGKTRVAHDVFEWLETKNLQCVIVNCDAFQVYRGLDKGTSKPTLQERARYSYECIDLIQPHEKMDAILFAKQARELCLFHLKQGRIPICVGGSGLYVRSFLYGLDDLPERSSEIRDQLRARAEVEGWPALHAWLAQVDPERASELHPNDKTRIERALEIFLVTQKKPSEMRSRTENLSEQTLLIPTQVIQTSLDPEVLKDKITRRVELFLRTGWIEEVEMMLKKYGEKTKELPGFQALGYLEILDFINQNKGTEGERHELVQRISTDTWRYARRQMVWNKKERCDVLLNMADYKVEEWRESLEAVFS